MMLNSEEISVNDGDEKGLRSEWLEVSDEAKYKHFVASWESPTEPAKSWTPRPLVEPPVFTFSFTPDEFQKTALSVVDVGHSIMVAAHTGAGKTMVAEYAIARSLKANRRVVYTAPVKALSNQKYRDFKLQFNNVGLITGDVRVNPEAGCMVMTTEILRNMVLAQDDSFLNELSCVVFDEIHYLRDKDRGMVWEEAIILLPDTVQLVFLSATLANATEFVEWVATLKQRPCHVIMTDQRPIPLVQYTYLGGQNSMLALDDKSSNRQVMLPTNQGNMASPDAQILQYLCEEKLLPAIVFTFSRRQCETRAQAHASSLDLTTDAEKEAIAKITTAALSILAEADAQLSQITAFARLLARGVAIHHSGLLPLLRELVELLFQEGLVKLLFATETFAVGINMPAKTVVFAALRKFDGEKVRLLTQSEYIQMSGRAGRRGQDTQGIVISIIDRVTDVRAAQTLALGSPMPMVSSFRLTYAFILHMAQTSGVRARTSKTNNTVSDHSFQKFQFDAKRKVYGEELRVIDSYLDEYKIDNDDSEAAEQFLSMQQTRAVLKSKLNLLIPIESLLSFLEPGRVVYIRSPPSLKEEHDVSVELGWAVVLNWVKKYNTRRGYVVTVLCPCMMSVTNIDDQTVPMRSPSSNLDLIAPGEQVQIVTVMLPLVHDISQVRLVLPADCWQQREAIYANLLHIKANNFATGSFPLLDLVTDLQIPVDDKNEQNQDAAMMLHRYTSLQTRLAEHPFMKPTIEQVQIVQALYTKHRLEARASTLRAAMDRSEYKDYTTEYTRRVRVLRRLGFVDKKAQLLVKGQVACQINSVDEVLLSELLTEGAFNELDAAQVCGLLACFFKSDKVRVRVPLHEALRASFELLMLTAVRVGQVIEECQLPGDMQQYAEQFQPTMSTHTYLWVKQHTFTELCGLSQEVFEGSIIHCLKRVHDLLRQLIEASKVMGDIVLEDKFSEAMVSMKHGIAFANSLYF